MKIEHKIIKEKDYLAPIFIGGLFTFIMLAFNAGLYWLLTYSQDVDNRIFVAVIFTLFFCFGIYQGIKHGFYDPVLREEVIHVIK